MAKKSTPKRVETKPIADQLRDLRTKGIDQEMLGTKRIVKVRHLDPAALLREGKMPDILTPIVVRSVYQDVPDKDLRNFLETQRGTVEDALSHMETIDFVVKKSIADDTKLEDLTLGEKRWIFRLAMGPAELLLDFPDEQESDVADVAPGKDVPPAAE